MKFVINRKKWLRGMGLDQSLLHDPYSHKECCIGQVCRQLGVPLKCIRDVTQICAIDTFKKKKLFSNLSEKLKPILTKKKSILKDMLIEEEFINKAYIINDDEIICDKERERKLKQLFRNNGHILTFIN